MKKAQASGTGAAVLVVLIAVLIVVYILSIPPSEREKLLDGQEGGSSISGYEDKTLLLATPGRMDYLSQKEIEHQISTVSLYSTTNAAVLKSISNIYVKNAWFDKKISNLTFSIEDMQNTDDILLSFTATKRKGSLSIKLNGVEVFNSPLESMNNNPIKLPKDSIKENNILEFRVNEVGIKFWSVNEYALEQIKVTADVTDTATRESKQIFLVTGTEKENAEKSLLRFYADCRPAETGILNILLNGHNVFSAAPECGMMRTIEIAPTSLIAGENELYFKTSKGAYVIDNIIFRTELKEMTYPTHYFEVNKELFELIRLGNANIRLLIDFPDDIEAKKADLFINGHAQDLYTADKSIKLTLTPFINLGNNVIEIKPQKTLEIVNLRVFVES